MREEGFSTSKRTVWADLHSATAEEFIEELKRRQLADIALAGDNYEIRLKYRDLLLDKLMPRKVEQKNTGEPTISVRLWRPEKTESAPDGGSGDQVPPS